MKKFRKTIAWALSFAMVFTMIPVFTVAAGAAEPDNYKVGDRYYATFDEAEAAVTSAADKTIKLAQDVTENIVVDSACTLDLNGHKLSGDGTASVILINGSKSSERFVFTLTDSGKGGTVTGGTGRYNTGNDRYDGGGVYVHYADFIMNGGTISGNSTGYGGGVFVYEGKFTMNGGAIAGNSAVNGGGIFLSQYNGVLEMNGGVIRNNAASSSAGGVYLSKNSIFNMNGGSIVANTAQKQGGVYLHSEATFGIEGLVQIKDNSANSKRNDVYIGDSNTIDITGRLIPGSKVGIVTHTGPEAGSPAVFTDGWQDEMNAAAPGQVFFPDNTDYSVDSVNADGSYEAALVKEADATVHAHSWVLVDNGNGSMTACCTGEGYCDRNPVTVSINEPEIVSDKEGNAAATLTYSDPYEEKTETGWTELTGFDVPEVTYMDNRGRALENPPESDGSYTALAAVTWNDGEKDVDTTAALPYTIKHQKGTSFIEKLITAVVIVNVVRDWVIKPYSKLKMFTPVLFRPLFVRPLFFR